MYNIMIHCPRELRLKRVTTKSKDFMSDLGKNHSRSWNKFIFD